MCVHDSEREERKTVDGGGHGEMVVCPSSFIGTPLISIH
jgi:hypothetical protein